MEGNERDLTHLLHPWRETEGGTTPSPMAPFRAWLGGGTEVRAGNLVMIFPEKLLLMSKMQGERPPTLITMAN